MAYVDESGLEYYSTLVKKDIDTKASIDSPALTGTPTAPTPEDSTNESQIATVGYVGSEVSSVESNVESVKSTAEKALDAANDAQSSATIAQTSAESAQTAADKAQRDATDALDTVNDTRAIAEDARSSANEALNTVNSMSGSVEAAISASEEASELVNNAVTRVNDLDQDVADMKLYNSVGDVDVDDYHDSYSRIYVTSGSSNIPTFTESYYIDVDVTSDMIRVRQTAIGAATGNMYVRNGSLTDNGDFPLEATSGTLVISGNVGEDVDLYVNGNVSVGGTISGTVSATGTIAYTELEGTINQRTDISANNCNISVDNGSLTFSGNLDLNDDNLHTDGTVTNEAITELYATITIETDSKYGLYNSGNITVRSGNVLTSTVTNDDGYGVYNTGTFVVNGNLYGNASTEDLAIYGEFSGSGRIYANGNVYYDGSGDESDPDALGYAVEWDEWALSGAGIYLPLSGGTVSGSLNVDSSLNANSDLNVTGDVGITGAVSISGNTGINGNLNMGNNTEIVANGLTITADGHIKLPSGVEIF